MKKMKCDHCKRELTEVQVISSCWQRADLEGNQIARYHGVEEGNYGDIESIICPHCGGELKEKVSV